MQNKLLLFLCLILCVWGGAVMTFAEDETLTIQTYYPSPNGVYKDLQTQFLRFPKDRNGIIGFKDADQFGKYNQRLRITAGKDDTGDNSQGASIDLHGNAAGGRLDLVAGENGDINFFSSSGTDSVQKRMQITAAGDIEMCKNGICYNIWKDYDGDGKTFMTGDCDESCADCFVGSTATTTTKDGKDQNCNGVVDEKEFVIGEKVIANSGTGKSCNTICAEAGRSCSSMGTDSQGSNRQMSEIGWNNKECTQGRSANGYGSANIFDRAFSCTPGGRVGWYTGEANCRCGGSAQYR